MSVANSRVLIERPLIRHYLLPIPAMDPKRVDERKGSIANIESVCAAGVPSDEVIKSPLGQISNFKSGI